MSTKFWQRVFSFIVLAGLLLSLTVPGSAQAKIPAKNLAAQAVQEDPLAKIEKQVLDEIAANGQTDFFITLKEQADVSAAEKLNTKLQKGEFVFNTLRATAERTQKDLRGYLDQQGASYKPYYIANTILVSGGSQDLAMAVASRPDVGSVTANHKYQLEEPIKSYGPESPLAVEPNLSFVNADDVWALGVTGTGVVLAGNDTGLSWTHPAIQPHYRGWDGFTADHNYNWWDATGTYPTVPDDGFGHGTHTTGTMVGDDYGGNQIGVAPGAKTIHCKNMDNGGFGNDAWFIECFEWDLAPWDLTGANADPAMAPDAVNNSWGWPGGGVDTMRTAINNLQAAGTLVEVSAGNEGPGCSSLRSPGDYQEVLTTGSVWHGGGVLPGTITGFSSRGPSSLDGNYFPDIMAPGENIRSSLPGGAYNSWSGTSMAGPHSVGLVGLLWSAAPALRGQVDATNQIIKDTAVPLTGQMGSSCGGDYDVGPNNDWGVGAIDALAAVQLAIAMGGAGSLDGTVTDAVSALPVADVAVTALHEDGFSWTVATNASGYYTMTVAAGTFTVSTEHPGYQDASVSGVVVLTDTLTTQNFTLTPRGTLEGYVTDFDNGFPLEAMVMADDGTTAYTDPLTGYYMMYLDPGTYDVTASADNYAPRTANVDIESGVTTDQDFELEAAVSFNPSPLEATLTLGDAGVPVAAQITNRQPWDYAFEFQERQIGFTPVTLGVPPSTGQIDRAQGSSSKIAPAGYIPNLTKGSHLPSAPTSGLVAIFKDANPWGTVDVETFLATNSIPYEVHTSSEFGTLDFSNYGMIIFSGDQPQSFYDTYAIYVDKFESYVEGGGFLNFFSCDSGWNGGTLSAPLPGGMIWTGWIYENYNNVDDPAHSVVAGVPNPFYGNYASHGHFTTLPGDAHVIASEQIGGLPTIVEYPLGAGWFVAFGQPLEISHNFGWDAGFIMENTLLWGNAFEPALDVLWLGEAPITGTVPASVTVTAAGTLDVTAYFTATAAAGVSQPGEYTANLRMKGDPSLDIPVIMTVEPPDEWGKLDGTVTGLGYCDVDPSLLVEAEVLIEGQSGYSALVTTDENGYYQWWLDEMYSPVTVTVTFPGYETGTASGVVIVAPNTTVVDFDLRWLQPCASVTPSSLETTLDFGQTDTQQVTIYNEGAADLHFQIAERDKGYENTLLSLPPFEGVLAPDTTPSSAGRAPNARQASTEEINQVLSQVLAGEPAFAVDVYPGFNLVSIPDTTLPGSWNIVAGLPGNAYFGGDFLNGDFSKLYVVDYGLNQLHTVDTTTGAVTVIGSAVPGANETWTGLAGSTDGILYGSASYCGVSSTLYEVDPDTGTTTEIGDITNGTCIIDIATNADGEMYGVDIVNDVLVQIDPATGAGTVIGSLGASANFAQGLDFEEDTGILYWAAYTSQGELRVIDTATGNSTLIGAFPGGAEVDSFAFATGGGGDVPWLYEDPITGTVPADTGVQVVDVTFDANEVGQPGVYTADLIVKSDDPVNDKFALPVTMTITAPPDWGKLLGTVTGLGYCDVNPAPLADAEIYIVGDGGLRDWTLTTDSNGFYSYWFDQDYSPLTMTVTGDNHSVSTAVVYVTGGMTTTQDFDLRWLEPCVSAAPASLDIDVLMGQVTTTLMTLGNTGAAASPFELKEKDGGYSPVAMAGEDVLVVAYDTFSGSTEAVEAALDSLGVTYLEVDEVTFWGMSVDDLLEYQAVFFVGIAFADSQNLLMAYLDAGGSLFIADNDLGYAEFGSVFYTNYLQSTYQVDDGGATLNGEDFMAGLTLDVAGDPYPDGFTVGAEGLEIFYFDGSGYAGGVAVERNDYKAVYLAFDFVFLTDPVIAADLIERAIGFLAPSDVYWLTEVPITGTLPADVGVQDVDVTFDSSSVPQPGKYYATLKVKSDDPFNGLINVPVTMTVNPTADYGILVGTVTSPGYCEINPGPIEGAVILIESASGVTYTVETDAAGEYSRWLQVADGPYIVSVTAEGYAFDLVSGVVIEPLGTTAVGFDLRWLQPCVSAVPPALVVDVALGYQRTVGLDLVNDGAGSSLFKIGESSENPGLMATEYQPAAQAAGSATQLNQFGKAEKSGTSALMSPTAEMLLNQAPNGANGLFNDSDCGLCGGQQSIAENFYLPDGAAIGQIVFWTGYFPGDIPQDPDEITVIFHEDQGGVPGAAIYTEANVEYEREQTGVILFGVHEWVHTLTLGEAVILDPGNYWVEIYNNTTGNSDQFFWETGDLDPVYGLPGSAWTTATPGISWNYDGFTDLSIQLITADLDVPWLAEAPITGTIAHDSSFPVDVTFTAFPTLTVGSVYTAFLNIKSDDPMYPKTVVSVTMNVVEPAYGVEVSADQVGSGEPGSVVTYTVTVTNTSNFAADSFTVTLGTHAYTTTLSTDVVGPVAMGATATFMVTVVIPDDALDGDNDTVQITVTSVGDPTKTAITNVTTNVFVVAPPILNVYLPLMWKVYP